MKVEVSEIKEEPKIVKEELEASLWELESYDIKFVGVVTLYCQFQRIKNEIIAKVLFSGHQEIQCSRCLEIFERDFKKEFYLTYSIKSLGRFLEIDNDIREEVFLSWPMKCLCKEDCKGICPGCGRNLNKEDCICNKK